MVAASRLARLRLLSIGNRKYRQRGELSDDGKRDECKPGLLVEQARRDAADQPADSISGIKQTESQIALALRQDVRDNCLQQRVLCRIADTPKHHAEHDRREVAEKDKRREQ